MSATCVAQGFRHEALLYAGEDEFVAGAGAFLRDGIAAGEPALVVVGASKLARLRDELGVEAEELVHFADMAHVGMNPARIIPAWRAFVARHSSGGGLRGIGEPIWPARSGDELVECQRHESLLNVAFAGGPEWWLLCPYDTDSLDGAVIEEACRSHPYVTQGDSRGESATYRGLSASGAPFDAPLADPSGRSVELEFRRGPTRTVRELVGRYAEEVPLDREATGDLVLSVHEVAANSVRHGGGRGTLRIWHDDERVICEIRDSGRLENQLAGRHLPNTGALGGRGLWLANQLCDLVQIRSLPAGTVVRLHMRRS